MHIQIKTTLLLILAYTQHLQGLEKKILHRYQNDHHGFNKKVNNGKYAKSAWKRASNAVDHNNNNSFKDSSKQLHRNNNWNKKYWTTSKLGNKKRWNKNTWKNKETSKDVSEEIINDKNPVWKQKNWKSSKQEIIDISSTKRIPNGGIDKTTLKLIMSVLFVCYLIPACLFCVWLLLQFFRVIRSTFFMRKSLDGVDISVSMDSFRSVNSTSDRVKDLL